MVGSRLDRSNVGYRRAAFQRSAEMLRETDRFQTRSANGRMFTVVERRVVMIDTFDGKRRERLGTFDYTLDDGNDVCPLDNDEFEIVSTGLKIYRVRSPLS